MMFVCSPAGLSGPQLAAGINSSCAGTNWRAESGSSSSCTAHGYWGEQELGAGFGLLAQEGGFWLLSWDKDSGSSLILGLSFSGALVHECGWQRWILQPLFLGGLCDCCQQLCQRNILLHSPSAYGNRCSCWAYRPSTCCLIVSESCICHSFT